MNRRIAVLSVLALVLAACSPGDVAEFVNELPAVDLTQSGDPTLQAAGKSPVEVRSAAEAERNRQVAIAERDLSAIDRAQALRPEEPQYHVQEAVLVGALFSGGHRSAVPDALRESFLLVSRQNPGKDSFEITRIVHEMYLSALRDQLRAVSEYEGRTEQLAEYCDSLQADGYYTVSNIQEHPSEVAFYMAVEADLSLCR